MRACERGLRYQEAHEEHMALNGECPWCGHDDLNDLVGEFVKVPDDPQFGVHAGQSVMVMAVREESRELVATCEDEHEVVISMREVGV